MLDSGIEIGYHSAINERKGAFMAHQIERSERREQKQRKAKNGMRIVGKSLFVIVAVEVKRSDAIRKKNGKA